LDLTDETLVGTPRRMVHGYAELLTPREFTLTTFATDERYDELVLARSIPFTSVCEHHMLPFTGTATVGYLPGDLILGLSKLARVVELWGSRREARNQSDLTSSRSSGNAVTTTANCDAAADSGRDERDPGIGDI
jgi:GTP cyclohydrolase IA